MSPQSLHRPAGHASLAPGARASSTLLVALLVVPARLAGCGAGGTAPSAGASPSSSASAAQGAEEPSGGEEDDRTRRIRLAKQKRTECMALGNAIQNAQRHEEIVNVNDTAALQRVARELAQSAQSIERVEVELEDLDRIRDDYVENARIMAREFQTAASAKKEADRRAANIRFSERQDKVGSILERLNDYCNAPVQ